MCGKRAGAERDAGASLCLRYRPGMVATDTTRVSASPGELGTLRLNMLPVVFPDEIQKDVVYSPPYSDQLWEQTKGAGARRQTSARPRDVRDAEDEPSLRRVRPLLDMPVELVLPAHGEPTGRPVLERLLS
jgi:hypothetical protein